MSLVLMRIMQILHDDQRGGVRKLAAMIQKPGCCRQTSRSRPSICIRARDCRSGRSSAVCLVWCAASGRAISMRSSLIQSTASILTGAVGWACGCPLRVVHQTCLPSETALPLRLLDKLVRNSRPLQRQHRQQRRNLGRVRTLSGPLSPLGRADRDTGSMLRRRRTNAKRRAGFSICPCRTRLSSMSAGWLRRKNQGHPHSRADMPAAGASFVLAGAGVKMASPARPRGHTRG